ncbi:MAG TPA: ribosome recycling factor [Fimbriimonadales bacterium]|jgi:ribosome recycling factor|nr:ribosome recycling factor [Fimbriimonadales bacterium]
MKDFVNDAKDRMSHAVEATQRDFQTVRTGRATPTMLDRIEVEAYGTAMPINQLANISVPEPRQLLIQPFDKSQTQAIERAIQKSDLGINPITDGTGIRLTIPQMTEERRKEMVRQINARTEEGCVAVRNVRRDAIDHLKRAEKAKEISEDELKRFEVEVQKLTDKFIEEIHALQKKKDAELMEV